MAAPTVAVACSNLTELPVRLNEDVSGCNDAGMPMTGMPLHAEAIPDCTELEAHRAAYKRAKANDVIFVCIARRGRHWSVELDSMASSKPYVPDQAMKIVQSAAETLVLDGTVEQANIGADYILMGPIRNEGRAREIAAAFHAALYGLQRLYMAVPGQREGS